jgi:predicted kinase
VAASRGRLIIVCGLPGSGKTTRAIAIAGQTGGTRFSPDDWLEALALDLWDEDRRARVEQLQWEMARDLIRAGGTAIIEWGTWARSERDRLRAGARELGAAAELVYLSAAPEVLYQRISARGRETPPVTRELVESWSSTIEAPTPGEFALFDAPPEDRTS